MQVVIKPESFSIRRVGMSFLDYLLGPMAKDGEAATHSIGRDYEEDAGSPGAEKKTFPKYHHFRHLRHLLARTTEALLTP